MSKSATLANLQKHIAERQARLYPNTDRTPNPGNLREVAREQAQTLRSAFNADTIRAERAARTTPVPAATPAPRNASPTFAQVDDLLARIPEGRYALPKVKENGDNDVTFFEVRSYRGKNRIQMLAGAPGAYQTHPLRLVLQFHAARHILEDLVGSTALYGRKAARCGRCGSPLTRKLSRERGMGDHCAAERSAGR